MNFYDADAIVADAIPEEIAGHLGIPMRKRGKKIEILCPSHQRVLHKEDNSFGSAWLTPHGYTCRACGIRQSVIGMTEDALNLSYPKALKELAQFLGGEEFYIDNTSRRNDDVEDGKPKPLTWHEKELLGLTGNTQDGNIVKNYVPICLYDYNPKESVMKRITNNKLFHPKAKRQYETSMDYLNSKTKEFTNPDFDTIEYIVTERTSSTLMDLYRNDYLTYQWLVVTKAIDIQLNITDALIAMSNLPNDDFGANLKYILKKRNKELDKIIKRVTDFSDEFYEKEKINHENLAKNTLLYEQENYRYTAPAKNIDFHLRTA